MKTIRQIWDETPVTQPIKRAEYIELVTYIGANIKYIFPTDPEYCGIYWGKLGLWDKTIEEARVIIDKRITDTKHLNSI